MDREIGSCDNQVISNQRRKDLGFLGSSDQQINICFYLIVKSWQWSYLSTILSSIHHRSPSFTCKIVQSHLYNLNFNNHGYEISCFGVVFASFFYNTTIFFIFFFVFFCARKITTLKPQSFLFFLVFVVVGSASSTKEKDI